MVAKLGVVTEAELALRALSDGHDASVALLVRPESPADFDAVYALHAAAFERTLEADLYAALRRDGDPLESSQVGVEDGVVVASVVCSRAWVGDVPVVALGPVGVLPELQGRGYGSAVVRAAVAAASEAPLVALLGDPRYYGRFGFVVDPRVTPPDPRWAHDFQVLRNDPDLAGPFRYAKAFDDASE